MVGPELKQKPVTRRVLRLRDIDGTERDVPMEGARLLIGRGADADLRLDHGMVSRRHAEIVTQPSGRLLVRDLGSRNGTVVAGDRVTEREVGDGDEIGIGPFTLILSPLVPHPATLTSTRVRVSDTTPAHISTLHEAETPRLRAAHLIQLSEFGRRLLHLPEASDRAAALCGLMGGGLFHGRWAAVVRIDIEEGEDQAVILTECRSSDEEPYLSGSVLRAVRQKRDAVMASNVTPAADLQVSILAEVRPMATLACPLNESESMLDLLYVVLPPDYGTSEWLALATLAARQFRQAEAAWAARRAAEQHAAVERDLERARQIQMRLVPDDPAVTGLDVAIGFVPCRWVGGDYVDAVPTADGRLLLAVADVCGKGLQAALVAASLHAIVHSAVSAGVSLGAIMESANNYLDRMLPDDAFATMVAMLVDPVSGHIEYASAGHMPPLIVAPTGETRSLDQAGHLPLRLHTGPYDIATAELAPGELLLLYTDGLTELMLDAHTMLEISGLSREVLQLARTLPTAREVAAALDRRLTELQGDHDPTDDRTFLVLRRV